mgnify:CR=1 FL=1
MNEMRIKCLVDLSERSEIWIDWVEDNWADGSLDAPLFFLAVLAAVVWLMYTQRGPRASSTRKKAGGRSCSTRASTPHCSRSQRFPHASSEADGGGAGAQAVASADCQPSLQNQQRSQQSHLHHRQFRLKECCWNNHCSGHHIAPWHQ